MWPLFPLTELCEVIYAGGDAPQKSLLSKIKTAEFSTPVFSNGAANAGLYGFTSLEPRTNKPAITVSARGTIGHIELRSEPFLPIVRLIVVVPKIEKIDIAFLKYALQNTKIFSSGTSIPQLTIPMIKGLEIVLPPLAEQKHIVSKLDAAFAEIDELAKNTEARLESAKSIFEKSVKQYFSIESAQCEIKKLSEIANYFNGLTYSPKDVDETGTVVLRSSNIQNGRMDFSDIVRVNKKIKENLFVQPTDILICSRNGSKALIGKCSLVGEQDEPMTFGAFMMIVRGENNKYLQWFFKSKLFKEQIAQGENTAINQITRYMLDDVILPVPNASIQLAISNNLEAINTKVRRLQVIYQNKINELHALKSAILAQELKSLAA